MAKGNVNTNASNEAESPAILVGAAISRFFYKPIDVYYDCFEKQKYITVTISKLLFGGRLVIGNGIYIKEKCKQTGILVSQDKVYGYAVFKHGYILFGGTLKQTHFGYSLFKSKKEKDSKNVSTFCNYKPITEQNLKDKIYLIKYGEGRIRL